MPLTVKLIEKLTKKEKVLDEHGLYLNVRSATRKTWEFRYQLFRKTRWLGLGSWPVVGLAEARQRHQYARDLVRAGKDPVIEKRAAKHKVRENAQAEAAKQKTFEVVAQEYFDQHQLKWGNSKHRAQFLSTLEQYAFPVFGNLPIADIDRIQVLQVLDPIWGSKTETASRVRRRIENVLGFAAIRGYRADDNPARWAGNLELVFPDRAKIKKTVHHRALPYPDMPFFVAALRKRESISARAVEFLILTGSRTSEVTGAKWQEIDLEQAVWIVPAERMKAGREHRVPLSGAALALLKGLPREQDNPFVFIGARQDGLSGMAMSTVLKRMGYRDRATVHGFRSSFRDWTAEKTDYQNHIAEAALAHTVGDKVEAAYRRGDLFEKRRNLMEDWACYCEGKDKAERKAA
jgi:integrase